MITGRPNGSQLKLSDLETMMSLVYHSQQMHQIIQKAKKFAQTSVPVLLTGESGTGKDLLARYLHQQSPRADFNFVTLNCAAINETLIESELFGHEAGAFTGATNQRKGCFEIAQSGTLFLDEIGELSLEMQSRLLRVLENRDYQRVGGQATRTANCRIIAATNRDLQQAVQERTFRLDLYHRLNPLILELPPLRNRLEDLPILVSSLLTTLAPETGHSLRGVSRSVMEQFSDHHWPGNVRELRNVLLRSSILCEGQQIEFIEDFRTEITTAGRIRTKLETSSSSQHHDERSLSLSTAWHNSTLEQLEQHLILDRLKFHSGNRSTTALTLGITARTLRNKLMQYESLQKAS